ncbi:MAG: sulfite dehydrogenase [Candidimonas sp.]|nr:MAG: sulfite dehydrogenase [Candidimonas sp.]
MLHDGKPGERARGAVSPRRRKFLRGGATALAGIAAGMAGPTALAARGDGGELAVPESMKREGAPVGGEPYGIPSKYEKGVVRHLRPTDKQYFSSSSRSPLQDLDGMITPNGLFYERHHNGVPTIDPAQHRLLIHGLVEGSRLFTMEDIRRYPAQSRIHFIECSGNPGYKVYGKTAAQANGLVSCAEWTGVMLKTVLDDVGVKPGAKWVIAEGADGAGLTRSIPLSKCLDDAMLVYGQNGERLRPEQGYPLRVLVPGFEGNMNVKWLRRLQVSDEPMHSREETSKYTDLMPDGKAREFTYVMEAKSIITSPSGGQKMRGKGYCELTGIAWSGHGKIAHVDVSVDDGKTWHRARLQGPVLDKALTRFRFPWNWDGAPAVIMSRATDETGYIQPTLEQLVAVRGVNSVYHNNAMTPWRIAASGEVTNARL